MDLFIGNIELGRVPRVVGVLSDDVLLSTLDEVVEDVDILELRVDMFKDSSIGHIKDIFHSVKKRFDKPIIATVRDAGEGGYTIIDDSYKYKIYESVMPLCDAVDIEIRSGLRERIVSLCKLHSKLVIGSYHNLRETPDIEFMESITSEAKQNRIDIVKIAVMANTKDDLMRLVSFTINNKEKRLITLSMGDLGLISRIFNLMIGSLMTYGHLGRPSAPGQLSATDIVHYLRIFDPVYNEAHISNRRRRQAYV